MNKISQIFLAALLLMGFAGSVMAQADTKLETAVIDKNNGDYERAIKNFNEALKDPALLKPKNVPRAYFERGSTWMMLVATYAQKGDTTKLAEYQDAPLRAFEDYKKCKETDLEGKWKSKVDEQYQRLYFPVIQGCIQGLDAVQKEKNATPEEKNEAFEMLEKFAGAATEMNPDAHLTYDVRGQILLAKGDKAAALKDFQTARDKFLAKAPKNPDLQIAYVYYRIAQLERDLNKNLDAALKAIDDGKTQTNKEFERVKLNKANYEPKQWAGVEKSHQDALDDLGRLELDILLNSPEKLQEAIAKFEKSAAANPKDYAIAVAYAQLLEKVDIEKAIAAYEKAIAIEPSNFLGHFNLGALLLNKGVEAYKISNETEDEKVREENKALSEKYWKMSAPHLEKALEAQPCEGQIINALISVYGNLGLDDDFARIKAIKEKCK